MKQLIQPRGERPVVMSIEPDVRVMDDDKSFSYDLIVGIGTLSQWGGVLDFRANEMTNRGATAFDNKHTVMNIYREATEPLATKEETERVTRILDAKYTAADLPTVVEENCSHLTNRQKEALLKVLQNHEGMFKGTLGKWVGEEVHFE
eukprot:scaffold18300_cov116-Skeletonema_dohrnii-CCMP3373.AAC.1